MCSAPADDTPPTGDDRTARARIRDAAIARFAADGVAGTSIRAIAVEADVSPALVMHHFGSKDALRLECDEFLVAVIRESKSSAMAAGPGLDPLGALRDSPVAGSALRYLARTLADDSPQVAAMIDEMVTDAAAYMATGVENGIVRPSEHHYGRAAVLTMWSLGALVLHSHVERILGVDLMRTPESPLDAAPYFAPALEMLSDGVITPAVAGPMKAAFAQHEATRQEKETES